MDNWAGNYTFRAARVERPATVGELADVVRAATRVRAVGTRHCFNDVADAPGGTLLSLDRLPRDVTVDAARRTATVSAGVTYGDLGPALHAAGWAVPNLASLPHISVVGACATATHGSGADLGCLATAVAAVEWVTADGTVRTVARGDADFAAAAVHLGSLGVVTRITLDLVPTFDVEQRVYDRVPFSAWVDHLDEIAAGAYSLSGFTDWQADRFTQVWVKSVAGRPHADLTRFGGTLADGPRHPLGGRAGNVASDGAGAGACTEQLSVPGPWHERLPHFRLDFTPSSGEEIQTEYMVGRRDLPAAMAALLRLGRDLDPVLQIAEVRLVAADDLWMSPFYCRPSACLHFTWRKDPAGVLAVLPKIEAALEPFDPRPHWGKVFTLPADRLRAAYPKFDAFRSLAAAYDPTGKFRNDYARRIGL